MTFSPELENIKRLVVKMNSMMRLPENLSWSLKEISNFGIVVGNQISSNIVGREGGNWY